MKYLILIYFFSFSVPYIAFAQHQQQNNKQNIKINFDKKNQVAVIELFKAPYDSFDLVSVAIRFGTNKKIKIRSCSGECTPWTSIISDPHIDQLSSITSTLYFYDRSHSIIEFQSDDGLTYEIEAILFYQNSALNTKLSTQLSNHCNCEILNYKTRTQWSCIWGEDSPNFIPEPSKLTHFVIHHQAGFAFPPYDATVRAIWDYHVNVNGWSDIGYHWLIAPDGIIYKGRAWLNGNQNVLGAHACSCNSNKLGICLLGNLSTSLPTNEQYESLLKFLVWKSCDLDIQPNEEEIINSRVTGICEESILNNISGHLDVCELNYTECPGKLFYPLLSQIKEETASRYINCIDSLNTSIKENHNFEDEITVFPNPSNEEFSIKNNTRNDIKIAFLSNLGITIFESFLLPGSTYQNEVKLAKGTYIIKLTGASHVSKIIKLIH